MLGKRLVGGYLQRKNLVGIGKEKEGVAINAYWNIRISAFAGKDCSAT